MGGSFREASPVCPLEFESGSSGKLFFYLLWNNYHDFILSSLLAHKLCLLVVALGFVVHIFNLPYLLLNSIMPLQRRVRDPCSKILPLPFFHCLCYCCHLLYLCINYKLHNTFVYILGFIQFTMF